MSATEFHIQHNTRYTFEKPVFLEPHILRFFPATTSYFHVQSFSLNISPTPIGQNNFRDISGCNATLCWFENQHESLSITATMAISVLPYNPFSFLIHPPQNALLPLNYSEEEQAMLSTALSFQSTDFSDEIVRFVDDAKSQSNGETIPFLSALNGAISSEFKLESRDEGAPHPPQITFDQKVGSCRDLAWMQIVMLRNAGIAARFVSGYFYLDSEHPEWELHAWTEAYIPGAGWKGFDPSHGISCADQHIAVTASPFPAYTLPVTGSYRGDARATLTHRIDMQQNRAAK